MREFVRLAHRSQKWEPAWIEPDAPARRWSGKAFPIDRAPLRKLALDGALPLLLVRVMPDAPLKSLSLPNLLTVLRILAIPVIVILAIIPSDFLRSIALFIYVLAAVTDFFDGLLARMMNETSPLGRMLDPIADKLLVGALLIAFAWDHTFSLFDLIPALAILLREIFVAGLREFMGTRNVILHVSMLAKYKTTVQLIALGICMAEPMAPELRLISDAVLWLAALLTVWTGWNYWQGAWKTMSAPAETTE